MQPRRHAGPQHVRRPTPALVCFLLVVAAALPIAVGRTPLPDRLVLGWVDAHQGRGAFAVLDAVTRIAHWQWVGLTLFVVAAAVALARSSLQPVRQAVLAVLVAVVVIAALKAVFGRPGPTGVAPPPYDGAWPSGHAVVLVVATVVILRLFPALPRPASSAAFLPAVVVSAALVYCGHHWITDVLVAFPLGALLAWTALWTESWAATRIARALATR